MKTIKGILALALIVLANISFANDIYFDVRVLGEGKFQLSVMNVNGDASLSLWDVSGAKLYSEKVKSLNSISKTFDVSNLPNGKYTFRYEDDFKIQKVTFVVDDQLTFDLESSEVHFLPVISQRGNDVMVGLVANTTERLVVSIYDLEANLVIKEVIEGENYIGKKYDFSQVRKGSYNVVIASAARTISKTIEIK